MKRLLLTIALLLVVAVSTAQVTTSALRGSVTTDDKPLAGATIVAYHSPSGTTYGTTTNAQGYYSISGMRVGGPYTITISFIGYSIQQFEDVELQLGTTETINADLKVEDIYIENTVIIGQGVLNEHSAKNYDRSYYDRSKMATIPTIDRSIYDLTHMMSTAVSPASGGIVLSGQSNRYNAFTIDGSP